MLVFHLYQVQFTFTAFGMKKKKVFTTEVTSIHIFDGDLSYISNRLDLHFRTSLIVLDSVNNFCLSALERNGVGKNGSSSGVGALGN